MNAVNLSSGGIGIVLNVSLVPLSNGQIALVDTEDFMSVIAHTWMVNDHGYAVRGTTARGDKHRIVRMARQIMNAPTDKDVDHANGEKLNNLRADLRLCTPSQNSANRHKSQGKFTSDFKGVSWHTQRGMWRACICFNRKQICLGHFKYASDAARAYDQKAKELFGEFYQPNFAGR